MNECMIQTFKNARLKKKICPNVCFKQTYECMIQTDVRMHDSSQFSAMHRISPGRKCKGSDHHHATDSHTHMWMTDVLMTAWCLSIILQDGGINRRLLNIYMKENIFQVYFMKYANEIQFHSHNFVSYQRLASEKLLGFQGIYIP